MRVCAVQMLSSAFIDNNLRQAQTLIEDAKKQHCELVVLPENFACFSHKDYLLTAAHEADYAGPICQFLSSMARDNSLYLVGGTIPMAVDTHGHKTVTDKVFTACTVWNPLGELTARYDKCHLFDVDVADSIGQYRESDTFLAGDDIVSTNVGHLNLGLSICYDLRFPELYRKLQHQGADMISVPSAFTFSTGEAHWEVLLRARAIENQCYVIAANQGGEHAKGRRTWGHSCIIDPWGEILCMQQDSGPGIVVADIDNRKIKHLRQSMPVLRHRKFF